MLASTLPPSEQLSTLLLTATNSSHRLDRHTDNIASWVKDTTPQREYSDAKDTTPHSDAQHHEDHEHGCGNVHGAEMCVVPLSPQPRHLDVNDHIEHRSDAPVSQESNSLQEDAMPVDWKLVVQLHRMVLQHQALIDQLSIELALERGSRISLEETVAELEAKLSKSGADVAKLQSPEAVRVNASPDLVAKGVRPVVAVEELVRCPSSESSSAPPSMRVHLSLERQSAEPPTLMPTSTGEKATATFVPPTRHVFTSVPAAFAAVPTCASSLPSRPKGSQKMWTEVVKEVEASDYY